MKVDRRRILTSAAVGVLSAVIGIGGARAQNAACYDPATLPLSQKSRRRSLGYAEASSDQAKHCSVCTFFTAGQPGCGACQLLNGPVNAGAVCSSFAPHRK
ncbi:hypothetical protein KRR38_25960 [Novosphingobium sp. G106]|uniref:hypothetical protein n=1 Tax=Novosphingobium sp. G106 TaxID=2849500 RepID=UPI001C2D361C|nr:hypothetical protein [Novosphingobium sp. G106]MBV1691030.1 hypothetical protein [Novosphingobium sp. G106]